MSREAPGSRRRPTPASGFGPGSAQASLPVSPPSHSHAVSEQGSKASAPTRHPPTALHEHRGCTHAHGSLAAGCLPSGIGRCCHSVGPERSENRKCRQESLPRGEAWVELWRRRVAGMQRGSSRGDDGPGFSHLRGALLSRRRREGVCRKRARAEKRGQGRAQVGRDASRAAQRR